MCSPLHYLTTKAQQEVVTGKMPYSDIKNGNRVMKNVTEGKLPVRPKEMSSATKCGDARWNMLLSCWNMKANRRPTALKVRDAVSQKHVPMFIDAEIHYPHRLVFYLDFKPRMIRLEMMNGCRLIVLLPAKRSTLR